MNDDTERPGDESSQGLALGDIYHVLFRHKWLILLFSVAGVLGAFGLFALRPPMYQSEAKLFIRYIVEGKSPNPAEKDSNAKSLNEQQASVINTEAQILQSWDVAQQVVTAIGPETILARAGAGTNRDQAADLVLKSLEIELPANGSVVKLISRYPDSEVAQKVLHEIIFAYIAKHAEMHQTIGVSNEVLIQETARLRTELAQTERDLRSAEGRAGVTSLDEAKKAYTEEISKIHQDMNHAEAELAAHKAVLAEFTKLGPTGLGATNTDSPSHRDLIKEYQGICERLDLLAKKKRDALVVYMYKEGSVPVQNVMQQIAETEKVKTALEEKNPWLATEIVSSAKLPGQPPGVSIDPTYEAIQITSLTSLLQVLTSRLDQVKAEVTRADEMETTIRELQRKKELQESNLNYFSASLEQRNIDQSLGSESAQNIAVIQWPSPPVKAWPKSFKKKVQMVAAGGFLAGLALAFLIELFLDRSVKRPGDVEKKLRLPLFISIPDISRNGHRRLAKATGKDPLLLTDAKGDAAGKSSPEAAGMVPMAAWDRSHPLRRYCEGLRDRLIVYFEVRNLAQKPKLVAVTSCGKGVGVTSVAAGLAASLSETGEGNVLLVDMSPGQGAPQQFHKGKPGCGLDDTLAGERMKSALVRADDSDAAERADDGKLPRALPMQFAGLMPMLKAGDYDYIVFDMPPVSQTSMTPRLSRLMDMVLLVIESEKTNQDVVKQAISLLAESKANVSAVLNKTRTYVPAWLHQEFRDEP